MSDQEQKQEVVEGLTERGVGRFAVGQLVPIGGVWFAIDRIEKDGLFLSPRGLTGKAKRAGR